MESRGGRPRPRVRCRNAETGSIPGQRVPLFPGPRDRFYPGQIYPRAAGPATHPRSTPGKLTSPPAPPPRASVSPRVTRPPGHPFLSSHSNRIPSTAKELIRNSIPQHIFASTSYIQRDHCCPANFPQTLSPSYPGGCGVPAALHHDVPTDPFCPGPLSSPGKMTPGGGAPKSTCSRPTFHPRVSRPRVGCPPGNPPRPDPSPPGPRSLGSDFHHVHFLAPFFRFFVFPIQNFRLRKNFRHLIIGLRGLRRSSVQGVV